MFHPLHCSKDQFVEKSNPLAMYTVNIKKKEHGRHPYLKLYIFSIYLNAVSLLH